MENVEIKTMRNVLIVEDESSMRKKYREVLRPEGFKVFQARDAVEVANMLMRESSTLDLIILDINLPGISGAQVLKKLKSNDRWKNIPVFPYSSLWNEKTDMPFNEHLQIVKDWYEAARHSQKVGAGVVAQVTPKYQGHESTSVIHPRLIVFAASVLIQQGFELSPSFEMMVSSARKVLSEAK